MIRRLIIVICSFFIFSNIEFESLNQTNNTYFQAFIFTTTLAISIFKPKFKMKLFYIAFSLLFLTVGFYLFQRIDIANSLSSVSIGMLLLVSFTYVPLLVKEGFVKKL